VDLGARPPDQVLEEKRPEGGKSLNRTEAPYCGSFRPSWRSCPPGAGRASPSCAAEVALVRRLPAPDPEARLAGERLAHVGEEPALVGEDFALVGGELALVGEDFAQVGGELAVVGEDFARVGEDFALVGEDFALVGEDFALVGEDFALVGEELAQVGEEPALLGKPEQPGDEVPCDSSGAVRSPGPGCITRLL
jgi:uncharacterized protein (UPF0179 family)